MPWHINEPPKIATKLKLADRVGEVGRICSQILESQLDATGVRKPVVVYVDAAGIVFNGSITPVDLDSTTSRNELNADGGRVICEQCEVTWLRPETRQSLLSQLKGQNGSRLERAIE